MRRIAVVFLAVFAAFAVFATVRQDASSETYSQVVDNSDGDRFAASKSWKKSGSGERINGDDYLLARPAKKGAHALFEVKIPDDGEYAVYVRWPRIKGLNDRVSIGVETAYGTKWTRVDQRRDGGFWVRIGEFEMRRDEKFPVRISHDTDGEGNIAADAVKVEKMSSYEEPAPDEGAEPSDRAVSTNGGQVVREARRYMGIPYKYATCTSTEMSCTCVTKKAFAPFGYSMSMTEADQVGYGRAVAKSDLRPGDLVYFREDGGTRITHVGIYSGNGKLIHASSYFGEVVESQMQYIRGYAGARRLV